MASVSLGVASNYISFVQLFMKISQMIQTLELADTDTMVIS